MPRVSSDDPHCVADGLNSWLGSTWGGQGPVLFLTGAGVSAESGIPTFRGEEGYWTVGSRSYYPEELATRAAFATMPEEVWGWYLYRRSVCRAASPNPGHLALADFERARTEAAEASGFCLLTQNVDGLHLRAGNSVDRTYQIHGNIDYLRCFEECDGKVHELPASLGRRWEKGQAAGAPQMSALVCPTCGGMARPHVLWFDESYDELNFRYESALHAATDAALVVVVGTSGATNLPDAVVRIAAQRAVPLVVVNRDPSPFSDLAENLPSGYFVQGAAGVVLPPLADCLLEQMS